MKVGFLASAAVLVSFAQIAAANSYRCTFTEVFTVSPAGDREENALRDYLLSQVAVVDRKTGKVFHPEFGNEFYKERKILDSGSKDSSFKVIALSGQNSTRADGQLFQNVSYFQINEYIEGQDKPFVAVAGGTIGIGFCK